MKVYLAGPITGSSYGQVTSWREEVKAKLAEAGITGYSPMRGKAYLSKEDKIKDSYSDKTMSSIVGINVRDYNDCKTADAILVYFPPETSKVSIGTVMEIAWGRAFQVPVVIVDQSTLHDHGMLTYGNIMASSLEEGIHAIKQLLNP